MGWERGEVKGRVMLVKVGQGVSEWGLRSLAGLQGEEAFCIRDGSGLERLILRVQRLLARGNLRKVCYVEVVP